MQSYPSAKAGKDCIGAVHKYLSKYMKLQRSQGVAWGVKCLLKVTETLTTKYLGNFWLKRFWQILGCFFLVLARPKGSTGQYQLVVFGAT